MAKSDNVSAEEAEVLRRSAMNEPWRIERRRMPDSDPIPAIVGSDADRDAVAWVNDMGTENLFRRAPDLARTVIRLHSELAEKNAHERPVQVVAGIAVRDGRVLLIRSRRHGVAVPGGKVEVGETHREALRREIHEETRLDVVRVGRYLHTDVQPTFHCHLYAVEVSEGEPVAGDDAEAAWWGDPAEILASNIPRDYPFALDVRDHGVGTHDPTVPWMEAARELAWRRADLAARRAFHAETMALRAELDAVKQRCRSAAQVLIEAVGARGPTNVDEVAVRAVAEIKRLRARVEGRSGPPSDAEIVAHAAVGGRWRVVEHACERAGNGRPYTRSSRSRELSELQHVQAYVVEITEGGLSTTWWSLDANHMPCDGPSGAS